jgi:hypothetical protein
MPPFLSGFVPWIHTDFGTHIGLMPEGSLEVSSRIVELDYETGTVLPLAVSVEGFVNAYMGLSIKHEFNILKRKYGSYSFTHEDIMFLKSFDSILYVRGDVEAEDAEIDTMSL